MFLFGTFILAAAQIQLLTAVSTVHHSCERIDHLHLLRSAFVLAKFLHQVKLLLRNNRLLCVLKNLPFILRIIDNLMHLVRLHVSAEIDRMTAIFKPFKNVTDSICSPTMQFGIMPSVISALRQSISGRCWNALFCENTGNLYRTISLNAKPKYFADYFGSSIINHPQIFVCIGLFIAVNRRTEVFA